MDDFNTYTSTKDCCFIILHLYDTFCVQFVFPKEKMERSRIISLLKDFNNKNIFPKWVAIKSIKFILTFDLMDGHALRLSQKPFWKIYKQFYQNITQ
jgi:hypothetical protein